LPQIDVLACDPAPPGYLHRSARDTGRNPDRSQSSPPRAKSDNAAEVSRRRRSWTVGRGRVCNRPGNSGSATFSGHCSRMKTARRVGSRCREVQRRGV